MILDVTDPRPEPFPTAFMPLETRQILLIQKEISINSVLGGISAFSEGLSRQIKHFKVVIRFFEQPGKKFHVVVIGTQRGEFCVVDHLFEQLV